MNKELTGQVDDKQIAAWKKEKGVESIQYMKHADGICYFIKPTRQIISAALMFAKDKKQKLDPYKFADTVRKNIWLGGDARFMNEDKFKNTFDEKIEELIETVDVELGEL